jgi:poly-gamma-glutamate synthase PgsB/CapB
MKQILNVKNTRILFLVTVMLAFLLLVSYHLLVSPFDYRGAAPVFKSYTFIVILVAAGSIMWFMGVREQAKHFDNLRHVPIRIHVNGIRGKSTVTRLIGGALREGGLRTLTKTTGKAARLIDSDGKETPIVREGRPNIREQVDIMNLAMNQRMDALVIECMAIQPELQRVSEHKMIQATIGVITNIRADHLDVLGPTLDDVAGHLSNTIPRNGMLITADKKYLKVFEQAAEKIGTQVMEADPEEIDDDTLQKFSYLNFKENVAVALNVARMLGIPDDVAIRGMLKARPDPGLMTIQKTEISGTGFTFINAFGVNDKDSTTVVFRELVRRGYFEGKTIVGLFHARGDRISRTVDFGQAMVRDMEFENLVLVGQMTNLFVLEAAKADYSIERIVDLGNVKGSAVIDEMVKIARENARGGRETVFFGCGNMVGQIPADILDLVERGAMDAADTGGGE